MIGFTSARSYQGSLYGLSNSFFERSNSPIRTPVCS